MPDEALSLLQRGRELMRSRRHAQAAGLFRAAQRLAPRDVEIQLALGDSLAEQEKLDEAHGVLTLARALAPDSARVQFKLSHVLAHLGRMDEAIAINRRAVALEPGNLEYHNGLLYRLHFAGDAAAIHAECGRWNERFAAPLKSQWRRHDNVPDPERPLNIGYVSNDFRQHVTMFCSYALLAHHDSRRYRVFVYSGGKTHDAVTEKVRGVAHAWRDIADWDDARLAETVRADGIDIWVDLVTHMVRSRLLAFARKPAPVQAMWMSYPGCTGMEAMDYRLSDRHLDPVPADDRLYVEETVRLPDSFWSYDPLLTGIEVAPSPAAASGSVTFGSLNMFRKVTDATLRVWARILRGVAGSRLLMMAPEGSCRQRVLAACAREGVAGERIEFVGWTPRRQYYALYHRVDIAFDPFPFSGHTTVCDALWMGVPPVTMAGGPPAARGGASLLRTVGLPEWIAATEEDYVRIAITRAHDIPALAALRAGLRSKMEASPLMNGPRFAANMEAAYREMWRRWCAGHRRIS